MREKWKMPATTSYFQTTIATGAYQMMANFGRKPSVATVLTANFSTGSLSFGQN